MKRSKDNFFGGVDIGSSKICGVICELTSTGEMLIKGVGSSISSGLHKGEIVNPEELKRSIQRAFRRAERDAGVRPEKILTTIPIKGIHFELNSGFTVLQEDFPISEEDSQECLKRSRMVVKSLNQTLLHVIPVYYKVDGAKVYSPHGLSGHNLEIQSHLIFGDTRNLQKLTHIFRQIDLRIDGIVYDPLGSSLMFSTKEEREKGILLIDMGARFTKINLFKNNVLVKGGIIPIGGDTFTMDLAFCLNLSLSEAERLKILYSDVRERRSPMAEIVNARFLEWIRLIKTNIPRLDFPPFSAVLLGGGTYLRGLPEKCEEFLGLPLRHGLSEKTRSLVDKIEYATAMGIILYGLNSHAIRYEDPPKRPWYHRLPQWMIK